MTTITHSDRKIQKLDLQKIRSDFPILSRKIHGKPLVYLDNGASSQKPNQVIDAIAGYYRTSHSNVHRGAHLLSQEATDLYENARISARDFLGAASEKEINFVRGTTEAINLVAYSYGLKFFKPRDQIMISAMEHHSNIVPWQMLAEKTGAELIVIPINEKGEIRLDVFESMLSKKVKMLSIVHISNSLGTINPVKEMISMAHKYEIPVLIDGAQAAPHIDIDVQELDADFYAFSGHKMYGPTGIGVLYGKEKFLTKMDPFMGGGEMISSVSFEKTTYNDLPYKFEAGTPNIAGAIGLAAAVDYISEIGHAQIQEHESALLQYATERLSAIEGIRLVGTAENKAGVLSFLLDGTHPADVGTLLDQMGIAVRVGHHCTQPLMDLLSIPGTVRASFAVYNTIEEVDHLAEALVRVKKMLQ